MKNEYAKDRRKTTVVMINEIKIMKRGLKTDNIISVFLRSSIGPKTRKASSDPEEKVLTNDAATKASDVEHRDNK